MLLHELQDMGRSDSLEKLSRSTSRAAEWLGFQRFALLLVTPTKEANRVASPGEIFANGQRFASLDNVPPELLDSYQDVDNGNADPVMQHARTSAHPLIWSRDNYEKADAMHQWEVQAPFGYAEGLVMATHLADSVHVVVGLDTPGAITSDQKTLTRLVADFQLFVHYAVAPTLELLKQRPPKAACGAPAEAKLTDRERECLKWAFNSKSAWAIGRILGISDRTVTQHLANARRKLDCLTTFQAAIKAIQLGLISM